MRFSQISKKQGKCIEALGILNFKSGVKLRVVFNKYFNKFTLQYMI